MGNSMSSNTTAIIENAVTNSVTKILQKDIQLANGKQEIIIDVHNGGDVIFENNVQVIHMTCDMKAIFNQMVSGEYQQNMAAQVAQVAKAAISGLNLGNFSESMNNARVAINETVNITCNIKTICKQLATTTQTIKIYVDNDKWHGSGSSNTIFTGNRQSDVMNLVSKCIGSSVNNNKVFQKAAASMDQSATSKTTGLSLNFLMVIAVILLALLGGLEYAAKELLVYMFPILTLVGAGFLIGYFATGKEELVANLYKTISSQDACGNLHGTGTVYTDFDDAKDACKDCMAIDWYEVSTGKDPCAAANPKIRAGTPLGPCPTPYKIKESKPFAVIYNNNSSSLQRCIQRAKDLNVTTQGAQFRQLVLKTTSNRDDSTWSSLFPNKKPQYGDAVMVTSTNPQYPSKWVRYIETSSYKGWDTDNAVTYYKSDGTGMMVTWGPVGASPSSIPEFKLLKDGDVYFQYNISAPSVITKFTKKGSGIVKSMFTTQGKTKTPKQEVESGPPPILTGLQNGFAYKEMQRKNWLLYTGMIGLAVGIIGTIVTQKQAYDKRKQEKSATGTAEKP